MNKTTQRAVIIDNISSPYIEQAIIILRDFSGEKQAKIIADAEKIVKEYLEKMKTDDSDITLYGRPSETKRKKSKKLFASVAICASIIAIALIINLVNS